MEDKDVRSNKANFINYNILTSNRFEKLHTVENTQNVVKIDDVIEIDVWKTRQILFVKSSKSTVIKRTKVVISWYPENQHVFDKENINAKYREETYTAAFHGSIKKDTHKISKPRGIWIFKFSQCTDG